MHCVVFRLVQVSTLVSVVIEEVDGELLMSCSPTTWHFVASFDFGIQAVQVCVLASAAYR